MKNPDPHTVIPDLTFYKGCLQSSLPTTGDKVSVPPSLTALHSTTLVPVQQHTCLSALKHKIYALRRLCPEQQRKIKPAKEMEDSQMFWHLWQWTFKTALRKPHSSEITRTAKQSPQLKARFSPTETQQCTSQTAKQQAALHTSKTIMRFQ